MNILLDPNIAYALLAGGLLLAVLALFTPGTGLLELGAVFTLLLAGYGVVNLPVNAWALGLGLVALIPLALAVRQRSQNRSTVLLVGGMLLLTAGSVFTFRAPQGGPAVSPWLAGLVSLGSSGLLWLMARKSLEAAALRVRHDPDRLVGMHGVARTDIRREGSVYAGGEEWSAEADVFIPAGTEVEILSRTGLVLTVKPILKGG